MTRLFSLLTPIVLFTLALVATAGEEPGGADRDAFAARLEALSAEDAVGAYRLALELDAAGIDDLAARAYEHVVKADPEHKAARRALGYEMVRERWYRGDDLYRAKGFIHHGGTWMTSQEFAEATRPQREAAVQKAGEKRVRALLDLVATEEPDRVADARRRLAQEEGRFKLAPCAQALRLEPASLRIFAAEELARLADPLAVPALLKRTIDDPDAAVRRAAAIALRDIGEPSTVHPLGRALGSRYEDVRVKAAEALTLLEDEVGAGYVVYRWEARSGDFPRVYFSQAKQISYIQDFDVEVAQTSFIADPIVGVLQEGVVQAVKILATEQVITSTEVQAYTGALRSLSGQNLGDDVRAWSRWWKQSERTLLQKRAARFDALAKEREER